MHTRHTTVLLLLITMASLAVSADALRACTLRELNEIRYSSAFPSNLLVSGTVQNVEQAGDNRLCTLEDETGRCFVLLDENLDAPKPGDRVRIVCTKERRSDRDKLLVATSLAVIGTGAVTPPVALRLGDLDDRRHDNYTIETEGTVVDVIPDEIDPMYDVLLLKDGITQIPLFVPASTNVADLSGYRIRVRATYRRLVSGQRRFSGPYLSCPRDDIRPITPPVGLREIPPIDPGDYLTPAEIAAMDRRALVGTILAVWGGDSFMLNVSNRIVNVHLAKPAPLPRVGTTVRVVGYPETDLYKMNLVKAVWTHHPAQSAKKTEPAITAIREIIRRVQGKATYNHRANGRLARLSGTVRTLPATGGDTTLIVETDGFHISVDIACCSDVLRDLAPGCVIEATGRCLMEIAPWRPYDVFPGIRSFVLVTRSADDVRILKSPPWWTPARLFGVVIALVVVLIGILVWNRILNRLVERRGRQLFRANIERAKEALRVEERTRLAVELHDSLSQNLTGVALQIKAGRHELAARILKSCREELRNCLWDLRNNAIDCGRLDEGIRQSLAPITEDVGCSVRFNVRRSALPDTTAYAIIRIVRELVANAIRHGRAKAIRVAGACDPGRILFSVQDDGCGFDPARAPGIADGHFGLQGIRERVGTLGGTVTIASAIGRGTKVVIVLPLPNNPHDKAFENG